MVEWEIWAEDCSNEDGGFIDVGLWYTTTGGGPKGLNAPASDNGIIEDKGCDSLSSVKTK